MLDLEPTRWECWHKKQTFSNLFFNLYNQTVSWKAKGFAQRLSRLWWARVSSSDRREFDPLAQHAVDLPRCKTLDGVPEIFALWSEDVFPFKK